ncbi:MAG: hypothetical protein KGL35_11870 [Bradyrhizobium sp.]|nr:hypothetical protein [Bradyrhizobium sp.]
MTFDIDHERRAPAVLPPPRLASFANRPWGVVIPSGAAEHWKAIAGWQFQGYATVEVVSGPAAVVYVTKAGRKAAAL